MRLTNCLSLQTYAMNVWAFPQRHRSGCNRGITIHCCTRCYNHHKPHPSDGDNLPRACCKVPGGNVVHMSQSVRRVYWPLDITDKRHTQYVGVPWGRRELASWRHVALLITPGLSWYFYRGRGNDDYPYTFRILIFSIFRTCVVLRNLFLHEEVCHVIHVYTRVCSCDCSYTKCRNSSQMPVPQTTGVNAPTFHLQAIVVFCRALC